MIVICLRIVLQSQKSGIKSVSFKNKVEVLGKSTLNCIEYSNEKYRKTSTTLYKQGQKIRNELLKSDMYHSYSKLYTK